MKTTLILLFTLSCIVFSQAELEKKLSGEYNPLELVSISQDAVFNQAVKMLSAVSELVSGKSIVSTVDISDPIGVEIKKMPYRDALNLIVNAKDLTYEEKESSIIIKSKEKTKEEKLEEDIFADITAREVKISAIFFEADVENSKERGIDWNVVLSKDGINLGSLLRTRTQPPEQTTQQIGKAPEFNLNTLTNFRIDEWKGSITALFRFFENQNLGEILASPNIIVREKQKGRIQIGSDFSIKQRDFSGNIIDRFYSAGSIIEVIPYVYRKNNLDYILLKLHVERSTFFPSDLTTEIKKTAATSDVLLLNNEQTVIGGLYINEENIIRNGIPILKDLPWWVFGIRYLAGSDQPLTRKKEVIILLQAELLPTLEERAAATPSDNLLQDQLKKDKSDIEHYWPGYLEKEK